MINKFGIIYKVTNIINGKCYIGQTISRLKNRKANHKNRCDSPKLANAIIKYGWENFMIEPICSSLKYEDLDSLEIFFIHFLDSVKNGYNISHGGQGKGRVSRETKEKISIGNTGKVRSVETRQKLSINKKEFFKDKTNHPMYGKPMPKLAHTILLERNDLAKKAISQYKDDVLINTYTSITECCKINKFLHEAISRAARGKTKTSYGYTWEFKDKITT